VGPVPAPVPGSVVEPQQPVVELGVLVEDLMELLSAASLDVYDDDSFGGLEAASALGVLVGDLNTLLGAATAFQATPLAAVSTMSSLPLEVASLNDTSLDKTLGSVLAVSGGYADKMFGSVVRLSSFLEALNDWQFSVTNGSVPLFLDLSCLVLDLLDMMQHTTPTRVFNDSITSEVRILSLREDLEHLLLLTDDYIDTSAPCPIKQSYDLDLLAKELATVVQCEASSHEAQDSESVKSLTELQVLIEDLELLTQHALSFIEATQPKSEDEKPQVQKMAFLNSISGT